MRYSYRSLPSDRLSFGGVLAYEIALQLLGHDQEVEFLGLIDSTTVGPGGIPGYTTESFDEADILLQMLVKDAAEESFLTCNRRPPVSRVIDGFSSALGLL